MLKSLDFLERSYLEDFPDLDEARVRTVDLLALNPENAVEKFYRAVSSAGPRVIGGSESDGSRYEPLFGGFVADDNPMWRN